jgi:hypothetical protein
MKITKALFIFGIYLVVLCLIYYIHIQYFQVDVVFYSALMDVILANIFILIIFSKIKFFSLFNIFEKIQLILICLLAGYGLAISVPTVIDRSLSFYILEKIEQRGGGIKLSRFEEVFTKEYAKEHRLVDVRLTEQQKSATVKIENDCVKLTKRGEILVSFSQFFRRNLLPKQRLLMGQYTDDLTHLFSDEDSFYDYQCN